MAEPNKKLLAAVEAYLADLRLTAWAAQMATERRTTCRPLARCCGRAGVKCVSNHFIEKPRGLYSNCSPRRGES